MDHAEHSAGGAHDAHSDSHHHGNGWRYFYVFLALCVLSSASFFTYSDLWPFHEQPQVGWFFMMAVSCTKALLVMLFFMHLLWEADWKYVLTVPASIMSILLILALVPDIGMRTRRYSQERQQFVATKAESKALRAVGLELAEQHGEHAADHGADGASHDEAHGAAAASTSEAHADAPPADAAHANSGAEAKADAAH